MHVGFKRASGSSISIQKWMHCGEVIVQRECLYQWVVPAKLPLRRLDKIIQSGLTCLAALTSSVSRDPKCDNLIRPTKTSRRAMAIIATRDHTGMNAFDQICSNGQIARQLRYPSIGLDGSTSLPLRQCKQFLGSCFWI